MKIAQEIIECTLRVRGYSPTEFEIMVLARGIDGSEKGKCLAAIEKRLASYPYKRPQDV